MANSRRYFFTNARSNVSVSRVSTGRSTFELTGDNHHHKFITDIIGAKSDLYPEILDLETARLSFIVGHLPGEHRYLSGARTYVIMIIVPRAPLSLSLSLSPSFCLFLSRN